VSTAASKAAVHFPERKVRNGAYTQMEGRRTCSIGLPEVIGGQPRSSQTQKIPSIPVDS
jgi:hypothetical protein